MRTIWLLVVLGGCVADAEEPPSSPVDRMPATMEVVQSSSSGEQDLCVLASQLPSDDVCSLMCDPTAMADRLLADGSDRGACYEFFCDLAGDAYALVGVCLP